jgi:hypothetical protein
MMGERVVDLLLRAWTTTAYLRIRWIWCARSASKGDQQPYTLKREWLGKAASAWVKRTSRRAQGWGGCEPVQAASREIDCQAIGGLGGWKKRGGVGGCNPSPRSAPPAMPGGQEAERGLT